MLLLVVLAFCITVSAYPSEILRDITYGQWKAPGAGDVRGPCPGLNTLANHGYLPRSGQNITLSDLTGALENIYNFSTILANTLSASALLVDGSDSQLRLDALDNHDTIEHDASMTRGDFYFGNNYSLNTTLLNGLIQSSSDGNTISEADFAYWQSIRQNTSSENNPTYTFGLKQQTLAAGEPSLFLAVFGFTDTNGSYSVDISSVKTVFGSEQLPPGWNGTVATVSTILITELSSAIQSMWDVGFLGR